MRFFGFFGDAEVSAQDASAQIKGYQKKAIEREKAKSFRVWLDMYANPYSKKLLYADHLTVARAERRMDELAKKPDSGVRAVAEVAKVKDKLVETKDAQAKVQEEIKKKVAEGDTATAAKLVQTEKMLGEKSDKIGQQLTNRANEGMELAKAKAVKEKSRTEVLQKRQAQGQAAPHLSAVWAKHDALYEKHRTRVIMKHEKAEDQAAKEKAQIAQLPPSVDKDAKMERLRQQEAKRRVNEELELAKLDNQEAGRLDARAKIAGMKQIG